MDSIFVYGARGHAKVVIDAIRSNPAYHRIDQLVDDDRRLHGRTLMGHLVSPPLEIGSERGFIAIGNNASRQEVASRFRGWLVVIAHRSSILAPDVAVGEGTIFLAGSIVSAGSRIGENVIINTAASVDHDCVIEDGVHVAPGCRLCGNVHVGSGTLLGAGTIVVPGVRIGKNVFVHAGQVISKAIPDGTIVPSLRPQLSPT